MPWKRTTDLAKDLGVTTQTIRNMMREGRFERVSRTAGGHIRIWVDAKEEVIGYCRVSSAKQRSSLNTQRDIILGFYPDIKIVSDIGSGFNFNRKGFVALLERAMRGDAIHVVVATQDRLTRVGFPFVARAFELPGGRIECLEEQDCPGEFDINTLVAFLTSFCNSQSGKRSHRRKKDKSLSKE